MPIKVKGLLLAGRNISGTHIAHSNFRAMPICIGIGEAALSIKNKAQLCDVDVKSIQKILLNS